MRSKKLSRDMTKPTVTVRPAKTRPDAQSDQSLRRPHEETLGP